MSFYLSHSLFVCVSFFLSAIIQEEKGRGLGHMGVRMTLTTINHFRIRGWHGLLGGRRRDGAYGPCLPFCLRDWRSGWQPLSKDGGRCDYGPWPSSYHDLAPAFLFPECSEDGHSLCPSDLKKGRGPWLSSSSYFHKEEVMVWPWPSPFFF